jgi:hypothetical protein
MAEKENKPTPEKDLPSTPAGDPDADKRKKRRSGDEDDVPEMFGPRKKGERIFGFSIAGKVFAVFLTAWVADTSYYAFAFFICAMVPAFIAMTIDRSVGRFASKTVAACSLVGVLPYLFEIAVRYEPDLAAKEVMYDYRTWLYVYGFALVGWMLVWLLPQLTVILFTMRAESRVEELERRQERIMAEWGDAVKIKYTRTAAPDKKSKKSGRTRKK